MYLVVLGSIELDWGEKISTSTADKRRRSPLMTILAQKLMGSGQNHRGDGYPGKNTF